MSASADVTPEPEALISAASRVATTVRSRIIEGALLPGVRLPEEQVRSELNVSRSTLREAFQLLIRERLLVHRLSRGFFVRQLSRADISDLYKVRRIVECSALRQVSTLQPQHLREISLTIADGQSAAEQRNWPKVAAASIRFHEALVALAGSDRLNALMSQVLGEFRLSYALMDDPFTFHGAFLERHLALAEQVRSGDLDAAADSLAQYLEDAERALLEQYGDRKRRV